MSERYGDDSHWSVLYKRMKERRDELQQQILGGTLDFVTYKDLTGAYREVNSAISDMEALMRGNFRRPQKREPLPPVD